MKLSKDTKLVMNKLYKTESIISDIVHVLKSESLALKKLAETVDESYVEAINCINNCKGRVVVTGVGKSGHIGKKIAATFASTGTPSFFVHADEAAHGDLGMILEGDMVICLSHSGESEEVLRIIPALKRKNNKIIVITGKRNSTLAKYADVCLIAEVNVEADPLDLAPMKSTTMALAIGDALASSLMKLKNFTKDDFAMNHPAGLLGLKLTLKVSDLVKKDNLPIVDLGQSIRETIMIMAHCHQGCAVVVNKELQVKGIFTEGDLCRLLREKYEIENTPINEVMTKEPIMIDIDQKASDAAEIIARRGINNLIVVHNGQFVGLLHVQSLVSRGFLG